MISFTQPRENGTTPLRRSIEGLVPAQAAPKTALPARPLENEAAATMKLVRLMANSAEYALVADAALRLLSPLERNDRVGGARPSPEELASILRRKGRTVAQMRLACLKSENPGEYERVVASVRAMTGALLTGRDAPEAVEIAVRRCGRSVTEIFEAHAAKEDDACFGEMEKAHEALFGDDDAPTDADPAVTPATIDGRTGTYRRRKAG